MKENKTEMVPVPLPTEVPPPPNLENIPLDILHSATVEMLIQQNDDLSSRLKVNIRRNSQLEQKIIEQEKEMTDLNRKRENVLAQIEIIKEKEKIWSSQKQSQQRQSQSLEKEMEMMELRYNELFATSQQKEKIHQAELVAKHKELNRLESRLRVLQKVRIRAKEKLRGFLLDMAHGIHRNQKTMRQSQSSNRLLKRSFSDLKNEITEKETFFKDQLHNLKEASKKSLMAMDEQLTELKQKNQSLREQKEQTMEEVSQLTNLLHDEKKNRIKLTQANEELAALKNERIQFKREMQNLVEKSETARMGQKHDLEKSKEAQADLKKQSETDRATIAKCEAKILELSKDNKEISDQLSAIQKLWMEAQEKLEKEELRSEALEKINRQLSQQNKKEKVERAIERSHVTEEVETKKGPDTDLQEKIQDVFATQYRTLANPSEMDL